MAVDRVDLSIDAGETVGLVGESGSGKSTLARMILRLIEPTEGKIYFKGADIGALPEDEMRAVRTKLQMIFQDPYGSLNPRMTILHIVAEPMDIHFNLSREEKKGRVVEMLKGVGLGSDVLSRYPHEFSGGQRQRIGIARAMILNPELVVADEPVSALDVTIQAQVIALLSDLQKKRNLSYLFIAHDLSLVERFCDKTAVIYLGKIVELAQSDQLPRRPLHPYTQRLLASVPTQNPRERGKQMPTPEVNSYPSYCSHHELEPPCLIEAYPKHYVACHLRPIEKTALKI